MTTWEHKPVWNYCSMAQKIWIVTKFSPNVTTKVSVECIKCLWKINKDHAYDLMLLTKFFLQLSGIKHHVNQLFNWGHPRLKLHWHSNMAWRKTCVRNRARMCLANTLTATGRMEIPRLLPNSARSTFHMHTWTMFPFFYCSGRHMAVKDKIMKPPLWSTPTMLNDLGRDIIRNGCFVVFEIEVGQFHFVKGWWVINLGMIGIVGLSSRNAGSYAWTLITMIYRYSTQHCEVHITILVKAPSLFLTEWLQYQVGPLWHA